MAIQVALRNKAKELATILPANPKYLALSKNFGESNMQLTGSSPEMLINLVDSRLLPKDVRIATRLDLEKAVKRASDFLSKIYIDCYLNLDSRNINYKINPSYAENLTKDLKAIGINLKHAKLIPYDLLTKKFRLSEKRKDTAKKIILNTNDFKWDYEPSVSGLFRAYLDRYGDWNCRCGGLAGSNPDCRVVVITSEASSQKILKTYTSKSKENMKRVINNAREKYQKEVASLRIE